VKNVKGFTLIELLVVVLIIGILAAIALPQYQKAVEISKTAQLKTLVKSVSAAQEVYFYTNGEYTTDFDALDITMGGTVQTGRGVCGTGSVNYMKFDDFEIIIGTGTGTTASTVSGKRTSGKYKCGGFIYRLISTSMPTRRLLCTEVASAATLNGAYCKLVGYPNLIYTSQWGDKTYSD
jgi:prepilin-type N-terminal cleavage/methylation domain-containing protein